MKASYTRFKNNLFVLCFCLFSATGVAAAEVTNKAMQDTYYAWCKSIATAKGDASVMVKFYAPHAILLPTLSPEILFNHQGGMNAYFTQLTSLPDIKCRTDRIVTQIEGDIAINSGLYTFSYREGKQGKLVTIPARFTFVYKRQDSHWFIINHHSSRLPLKDVIL